MIAKHLPPPFPAMPRFPLTYHLGSCMPQVGLHGSVDITRRVVGQPSRVVDPSKVRAFGDIALVKAGHTSTWALDTHVHVRALQLGIDVALVNSQTLSDVVQLFQGEAGRTLQDSTVVSWRDDVRA